ncbi:endolytic transglycosylase MltG [Arthrobacter sp. zg-ZUI100]|nr:endolytic transglycosylase MltG [Arthrobacter jiangjiafuii]
MSHRYSEYPAMDTEPDYEPTAHHTEGYGAHARQPVEDFLEYEPETRRSRASSREKQRRRRRRTIVMFVVLVFFAGVVFGLTMFLRDLFGMNEIKDYEGAGTGSVSFTVAEGEGPMIIGANLEAADIVATSKEFVNTFAEESAGREIQPGSYEMKQQMSSSAALEALLGEQGAAVHYAAVARDLRQSEVFEILSTSTGIPLAEFEALAKDPQAFGLPEAAVSLEGFLHPGEYRFPVDQDATSIVTEMVGNAFAALEEAGITDPAEQYRIMTKASIIQAEAGEADYAKVAGSIQNRLRSDNTETNGKIQSDATVTYGLGRKSYDITPEEKNDTSNPYNTYANPGLPVGPIGSPSKEAIDAAANPADVPFYYWVTVNLDTGQTEFSSTLAEHAKFVAQYQEWCGTQEPGRCG